MQTDISMRKERNLSSSSVYMRTSGSTGHRLGHVHHHQPLGCSCSGGEKPLGGTGQGLVPFPFLWREPSLLWPRASSAQRRCCSSDKPGAGAAGQGQEGGWEAATPTGRPPTLLLWSQGTESGTSVCLQETTYFLEERKKISLMVGHKQPQTVPAPQC